MHFMLGAQAFLLGDLDFAEERLQFAYDLVEGVDLEALARLALVKAKKGRLAEAEADLVELRSRPSLAGGPPSAEDLHERMRYFLLPFLDEPRLWSDEKLQPIGERFVTLFPTKTGGAEPFGTSTRRC